MADDLEVKEVSLTTCRGTFVAPTLRKARAMARKAAEEYEKERAEAADRHELARLRSQAVAFLMMKRKARDGNCTGYERVFKADPLFASNVSPDTQELDSQGNVKASTFWCRNGMLKFPHWRRTIEYVVIGPTGYVDAVVCDCDGKAEFWALGVAGESHATTDLSDCGLTIDDFPKLETK